LNKNIKRLHQVTIRTKQVKLGPFNKKRFTFAGREKRLTDQVLD